MDEHNTFSHMVRGGAHQFYLKIYIMHCFSLNSVIMSLVRREANCTSHNIQTVLKGRKKPLLRMSNFTTFYC